MRQWNIPQAISGRQGIDPRQLPPPASNPAQLTALPSNRAVFILQLGHGYLYIGMSSHS